MAEMDDAIARIRGPRIDDFFAPDANQSFGPAPAMDPKALPDRPEPEQSWGEYGMDLARGAPGMGIRIAGGMAGAAAGAPTGPGALATTALGLTAAEPWAQLADQYFTGQKPSLTRGVINVGAGLVAPNLGGKTVGRLVEKVAGKTVGRLATKGVAGAAQGYGVTAATTGVEEGRLPTAREARSGAGTGAAFSVAFSAMHQAATERSQRTTDALTRHQNQPSPETHTELEAAHQEAMARVDSLLTPEAPPEVAPEAPPAPAARSATGSGKTTFENAQAAGRDRLAPGLRTEAGVDAEYERLQQESTGRRLAEAGLDQASSANASGESSASAEALSRVSSEKAAGIRRLRVDGRTGKATPLFGPDAVDAVPGPHDVIVTEQGRKRTVLDQGSKVTPGGVTRATRPHQSGELRMSLIVDAAFRVAKGVKTLADFTTEAVGRFGEEVRPYLAGAWREGRRRATSMKAPGQERPMEPTAPVDPDLLSQIDAKLARAEAPLSKNPERQARMDATEKSTVEAIEAAHGAPDEPGALPGARDGKQVERMLRLRAIAAEAGTPAKEAWAAVTAAKKANAKGQHSDAVAIGKRHGLTTRQVHDVVAQYTDPVDRARAMRAAVQPGRVQQLGRLYAAGVRWNFLGTLRVPLKIAYINATSTGMRALATLPAAGYSRLRHRGNQHVFSNELPPSVVGYWHGLTDVGLTEALEVMKTGLSKNDLITGKYGQEYHSGKQALDIGVNLPSRALGAMDHLFIQPWAEAETVSLMTNRARARAIQMGRSGTALTDHVATTMARWREKPPGWALEFKTRTARRMSDSAALGKYGEQIAQLSNIPVLGPVMAPFLRTILNSARRTAQTFVPFYGMTEAATRIHKATKSPKAGETYGRKVGWNEGEGRRAQQSGALQREEAMRFGENVVGTLMVAAATKAILSGVIVGSAPEGMSGAEKDRLAAERPWRSVGGLDANTALGPAAGAIMAIADGLSQYQFLTEQGLENPKKARHVLDRAGQTFGVAFNDLLKGVPIVDNKGQFGYESVLRTLVNAVPFAPGITKNVNAMRGTPAVKTSGIAETFNAEVVGRTGGTVPRLSGVGQPIERRGVINPFSASPAHPNAARTNAARLKVTVAPPNVETVKTLDGQTLRLRPALRRVVEAAVGRANSLALDTAHREAVGQPDEEAALYYKTFVAQYHDIVMKRVQEAATERRLMTITELTEGLE